MNNPMKIAGVDVHTSGQGDDVVVMIHGWPDTCRLWDAQVKALEPGYRCVRFTLPGFDGGSPRRAYSLDELTQVIRKVVETCSPGHPVTLMVHDWGCLFGYQFAMAHPSLVSRIIGIDIGDTTSSSYQRSLTAKARLMIVGYQLWLAAAWFIGGSVGDRMTRFMARQLRAPAEPTVISSAMNYPYFIRWTGAHGSYRKLLRFEPGIPMLFIFGTRKPFMFHSDRWIQALNGRGNGSRAVGLPAGHWMMHQMPTEFNAIVLDWLGTPAGQAEN